MGVIMFEPDLQKIFESVDIDYHCEDCPCSHSWIEEFEIAGHIERNKEFGCEAITPSQCYKVEDKAQEVEGFIQDFSHYFEVIKWK